MAMKVVLGTRAVHRHTDNNLTADISGPHVVLYWDHASVRLPGVLQMNLGHSKFGYRKLKKFI